MRGMLALVLLVACGGNHDTVDATSDVPIPEGCGDGVKSATEECDQADLGGATCAQAAAPGWIGVVSCTSACRINIAGCNPPTTTWQAMTDPANWTLFDVSTLFPGAKGFVSGVFDGRYMYFTPNNNGAQDGIVTRYDTQAGFGSSGGWATFDLSTLDPNAKGFEGGVFDGRYLYLVPYNNGVYDGTVVRYDTQAAGGFGANASWTTFDVATVDPNARGFVRSTFDGRYVYFAPHYNGAYHGTAVRYDTKGSSGFASAASWASFDMATVNPNAKGYLGAVFDGRYIYYVPYYNGTTYHGLVSRFDTQGQGTNGFADPASWTTFDLATVNGNATGFYGGTFDGRYLYLSQYYNNAAMGYGGFVVRYDTQAAFGTPGSWSVFDVATVNAAARGFIGTAFDGRYVYLVPHYNGAYHGNVTRFDTEASAGFGSTASWSTFDLATINANAKGYDGAGFDGQYLYLAPLSNGMPQGIVARFNTKSPSWLPRGWNSNVD